MKDIGKRWLVEYNTPGLRVLTKEYFGSRADADAFMKKLPESYMAAVYQIDKEGRPVFDAISNFNTP